MITHKYINGKVYVSELYRIVEEEFKKIGFQKVITSSDYINLTLQKGLVQLRLKLNDYNRYVTINFLYNGVSKTSITMSYDVSSYDYFYIYSVNTYLTLIQNQSNYYINWKNDTTNNIFALFPVYDLNKENIIDTLIMTDSSSLTSTLASGSTPTINTILPNNSLPIDLVNQTLLINGADPIIEVGGASYGVLADTQIMIGTEANQIYQINNDQYLSLGGFGIKIN